MARVQSGDLAAFEQLVDRFRSMVYRLAHSILGSREDAEEAAQDAFVKLYRARDLYDPARRVEPWLLRIAGNTCRDALRRRRSSQLPVLRDREGESVTGILADENASAAQERNATRQLVAHELGRLTDAVRVPLELKYLQDMTNQQIADSLGISLSNVKVRVARGKDLLHGRLERVLES